MGTTKKITGILPTIAITIAIALSISSAQAASTNSASGGVTFFSAAPETTGVHSAADLNQLFQKGIGPFNDAMKGKLYPYPLPRNGQFGAPLYNGCYDRKGRRIHDLDANLGCATAISENPGKAIFRLFLGYKISCSSGYTSGTCTSAQLLMNCEYKQVQVGVGTLESTPAATRYCSNESGILRNAQGSSSNEAAANGCQPGEDGLNWSLHPNEPCPKCSPGFFNANFAPNNVAGQPCTAPTPLQTGVLSYGGWTSPPGATSAGDCHPTSVTCNEPSFHPSLDQQSCEPAPPACNLTLELTPKNPSATASPNPPSTDGQITANVSNAQGSAAVSITSPSAIAASNAPTLPAIFNGLSANTYTVTATDSSCTVSAKVTLKETSSTPSCSACPSGSTLSGSNCVTPPTASPSYTQYGYRCQGAGGCTSQPCNPTCTQGQAFGQVSSSDSTPRVCDGASLWTSFGGSCSMQSGPTTIPGSQSCPSGFSLVAGSCTMACTGGNSCAAGQYSPSGNGGDCAACPAGTFKATQGNATICDTCPATYIPNASSQSYVTNPTTGAISPTACSVNYSCPGSMAQGTNPAPYTTTNGYNNAFCSTVAPSPTPATGMLVYGIHAMTDCAAAGGTLVQGPLGVNESFCKFTVNYNASNSYAYTWYNDGISQNTGPIASINKDATYCPAGWKMYNNWGSWCYKIADMRARGNGIGTDGPYQPACVQMVWSNEAKCNSTAASLASSRGISTNITVAGFKSQYATAPYSGGYNFSWSSEWYSIDSSPAYATDAQPFYIRFFLESYTPTFQNGAPTLEIPHYKNKMERNWYTWKNPTAAEMSAYYSSLSGASLLCQEGKCELPAFQGDSDCMGCPRRPTGQCILNQNTWRTGTFGDPPANNEMYCYPVIMEAGCY